MSSRALVVVWLAVSAVLLQPYALQATACNTGGCWNGLVEMIIVSENGKIWFVVNHSDTLDTLTPPDGCVVQNVWAAGAERALFIAPDDPSRDEKYKVLLIAQTTGQLIGFKPEKDVTTGWCRLGRLTLGKS